jgi:hypothetical protein
VSIRFQADNDLNKAIVDAVLRREPGVDFQTAQAAGLDRLDDETVLRLAALEGRILVTHDKRSMARHLKAFVRVSGESPGVVIPQRAVVRDVVEALILIWTDDRPGDWVNR